MRTVGSGLATHLSSSILTLATCLRIDRIDGVSLGLTTHNRSLLFAGLTYDPLDGIDATSLRCSMGTGIDNLQVNGLLSSARITDADLLGGRYDNAAITLFLVNWADSPITDRLILCTGYLGQVTYQDGGYQAELRALSQRLTQQVVELTSPLCRVYQLGDSRCKVKLDSVNITAITQASPAQVTTATAHGRVVGDTVYVQGVTGMTPVNEGVYIVRSVPTGTTMTLSNNNTGKTALDSTGFPAYVSGGTVGYRFNRTVASVQSPQQITFGSDPNPTGFYTYGMVTFTTGVNAGLAREVKSHVISSGNAVLTLQEAFPFTVAVGDAATLEAGCDRTPAICNSRFANMANYRGENQVPGTDVILRRGRR